MRVKVNPVGILNAQKLILDLGKNGARHAVSRALKRAQVSVAKQAAIRIKESNFIKLSSARAKKRISVTGTFRGNITDLQAIISFSNKAESLGDFYARKVAAPKGSKRNTITGQRLKAASVTVFGKTYLAGKGKAFIVNKSGVKLVMMRTSPKRKPIKKLYGPSFSDYFIGRGEGKRLADLGEKRFNEVLAQEINYRLSSIKKK